MVRANFTELVVRKPVMFHLHAVSTSTHTLTGKTYLRTLPCVSLCEYSFSGERTHLAYSSNPPNKPEPEIKRQHNYRVAWVSSEV